MPCGRCDGAVPSVAAGIVLLAAVAVPVRRRRRREELDLAFRLHAGAPPADELRRVARGRVAHAVAALDGSAGLDDVTAVHEARKDLKRLRAIVRLAGPALGDTTRRREAAAFRDMGRLLGSARDRAVLVMTLDEVLDRDAKALPAKRYAALRATAAEPPSADGDAQVSAVIVALRDADARIEHWPLPPTSLCPCCATACRRSTRAAGAPTAEPADDGPAKEPARLAPDREGPLVRRERPARGRARRARRDTPPGARALRAARLRPRPGHAPRGRHDTSRGLRPRPPPQHADRAHRPAAGQARQARAADGRRALADKPAPASKRLGKGWKRRLAQR